LFLNWAAEFQSSQYQFPTFIPADELVRLDYFANFPHLVTMPVTLESSDENLERFAQGSTLDDAGNLNLTELAPVRDVFTPSASTHFNMTIQTPPPARARYAPPRPPCIRKEERYLPLQRQWSFSMREMVCVGSAQEVTDFLAEARQRITSFFK